MTFGSSSLTIHVTRGVIGVALIVAAFVLFDVIGWPALLLLGGTVWAFGGCPACWTVGLFETIAARVHRPPA
jgi:hypothetical protein